MCDKSNQSKKNSKPIGSKRGRMKFYLKKTLKWHSCGKTTKSFNFLTFYKQYGSFIKGTSNVIKKEDERKTQVKEITQAFKT
jgi:hypothetical protein